MLMDIDINGMQSKPNLLKTLGTNYFKITHWSIMMIVYGFVIVFVFLCGDGDGWYMGKLYIIQLFVRI